MNDTHRFLFSVAAGIIVFAAITALYQFEGRPPDKALIGATAAVAAVGVWHFLRYRKS